MRDLNLPDDIEVLTDGDQMIVRAAPAASLRCSPEKRRRSPKAGVPAEAGSESEDS